MFCVLWGTRYSECRVLGLAYKRTGFGRRDEEELRRSHYTELTSEVRLKNVK
ncbi:unnamed protein product, partial [Staurois parvus]